MVGGIYYGGYVHGEKEIQTAWDIETNAQTLADAKLANENVQKLQKAQEIYINNVKDYEGKINAIKTYYAKHPVLLSSRVCDTAKSSIETDAIKIPYAAARIDAKTENDLPVTTIDITDINWNDVARDSAETTQQLISLQEWLNAQINNFNAESK